MTAHCNLGAARLFGDLNNDGLIDAVVYNVGATAHFIHQRNPE
jgi:hypothetical protein